MKYKTRQQRNLSFKQIVKRKNKKTRKTRKQRKLTVRQIVKHKNKKTRKQQHGGADLFPLSSGTQQNERYWDGYFTTIYDPVKLWNAAQARAMARSSSAEAAEERERERMTGADKPGFKATKMAIARMLRMAKGRMHTNAMNDRFEQNMFNDRMHSMARLTSTTPSTSTTPIEPSETVGIGVPIYPGVPVPILEEEN